jgi:hypothetical protein
MAPTFIVLHCQGTDYHLLHLWRRLEISNPNVSLIEVMNILFERQCYRCESGQNMVQERLRMEQYQGSAYGEGDMALPRLGMTW